MIKFISGGYGKHSSNGTPSNPNTDGAPKENDANSAKTQKQHASTTTKSPRRPKSKAQLAPKGADFLLLSSLLPFSKLVALQ